MKKFAEEFKKFITRGNVVDMAVGVIVGSAFTAIVNGLSNFILKPLINYFLYLIFGTESLSDIHTYLKRVEVTEQVLNDAGEVIDVKTVVDLAQSIYIDWGSFIAAVLNFFIIAIVLFSIVKIINKIREDHKELQEYIESRRLDKTDRAILKERGIRFYQHAKIDEYIDERNALAQKAAKEAAEAKAAADAEAARQHRLENPTTEDLLKLILAQMKGE
jgi:large conductance mechanosensitive channel